MALGSSLWRDYLRSLQRGRGETLNALAVGGRVDGQRDTQALASKRRRRGEKHLTLDEWWLLVPTVVIVRPVGGDVRPHQ
jgi:hypothetical protein